MGRGGGGPRYTSCPVRCCKGPRRSGKGGAGRPRCWHGAAPSGKRRESPAASSRGGAARAAAPCRSASRPAPSSGTANHRPIYLHTVPGCFWANSGRCNLPSPPLPSRHRSTLSPLPVGFHTEARRRTQLSGQSTPHLDLRAGEGWEFIYGSDAPQPVARMTLSGLGCRLQTCSCLATEWFNSTFRAKRETLRDRSTVVLTAVPARAISRGVTVRGRRFAYPPYPTEHSLARQGGSHASICGFSPFSVFCLSLFLSIPSEQGEWWTDEIAVC